MLLPKHPQIASGLIAYCAAIKIYPGFLLLHQLSVKGWRVLIGFIAVFVAVYAASIAYFGLEEHLFYFKHILPVLLQEPVTDKWINLNLEKFLFSTGLIDQVNGSSFQIIRAGAIAASAYILWQQRRKQMSEQDNTRAFLIFSLFIGLMFFCFPNYWPQYQIFLLIPFCAILASLLKQQRAFSGAGLLLTLACLPLFVDDLFWQTLLNEYFANKENGQQQLQKLALLAQQQGIGPTLWQHHFKSWFFYYAYECRALSAPIMWSITIWLLLKPVKQANQESAST